MQELSYQEMCRDQYENYLKSQIQMLIDQVKALELAYARKVFRHKDEIRANGIVNKRAKELINENFDLKSAYQRLLNDYDDTRCRLWKLERLQNHGLRKVINQKDESNEALKTEIEYLSKELDTLIIESRTHFLPRGQS